MLNLTLQRVQSLAVQRSVSTSCPIIKASCRRQSTTSHDPLRVLFCGADPFSIASLRALDDIRLKHPEKIASIDVVCRPGKRVGRGLKQVRELPIKSVAVDELKLPLHQIDTFTGWSPPRANGEAINLVVAVSFGLFVPPRILKAAKYGGLNVHPSMLPDLAGSAPLHHALLQHDKTTGVTLQTLDLRRFDHGAIVDQTPRPGLEIPNVDTTTVAELASFIEPFGAEILAKNIMSGSFANPRGPTTIAIETPKRPRHAPKITQEDRHIDWHIWTVKDFLVRDRVIGRLWDTNMSVFLLHLDPSKTTPPRVVYYDFVEIPIHTDLGERKYLSHQHDGENISKAPFVFSQDPEKRLMFECADGFVSPKQLTIEGKPKVSGSKFWTDIIGRAVLSNPATSHTQVDTQRPLVDPSPSIRSLNTSTSDKTTASDEESNPSPLQISWETWTADDFLSPANKPTRSSHPILQPLAASPSKPQTTFVFRDWADITTPYRRLIARGSELHTPLAPSTPFQLGTPLFISKDSLKRVVFWVWADESRAGIRVLSPESVEVEGQGRVDVGAVYEMWMGKDGRGGRARIVGREELAAFHSGKRGGLEREL